MSLHTPSTLQNRGLRVALGVLPALVLAWSAAYTAPLHAQVMRCTDPTSGKVTYTDGSCAQGTAGAEIERRKSDDELAQERARTDDALRAKAERRKTELEQRRVSNEERAIDAAHQRAQRPANQRPNYSNSAACQQSREQYSAASKAASDMEAGSKAQLEAARRQMELDCMGPEAYSRLESTRPAPVVQQDDYWNRYPYGQRPQRPERPAPPQPAPTIARCDVFNCVDTNGFSHPRGGIGEGPRLPVAPAAPTPPRRCRSQGGSAPC